MVLDDVIKKLRELAGSASLADVREGLGGLKEAVREVDPAPWLVGDLDQVGESLTLERARYYLRRMEKSLTRVRTGRVNDLNLNRWKEYDDVFTDSLWVMKKRDSSGVHTAGYWGNFVPQIPYQLMRRYTRAGEWVLDPFAGSGTTLIECQRVGRNGIGIELQNDVAERARTLIAAAPNPHGVVTHVECADSSRVLLEPILERLGVRSVGLLVLHPPYFDIIRFSDDPRDLSNAASVDLFLDRLMAVVESTAAFLPSGRYMALVIGDKYAGSEWVPLGFLSMQRILEAGFTLKSIVVKNFESTVGKRNQEELWRYRALVGGFYVFKHEYVFIFQKKKPEEGRR